MDRESPGSPSKWSATRSPSPFSTWRSTALYAALSSPSPNQRDFGACDQSRTSVKSFDQVRCSRAWRAQDASESVCASSYRSALAQAALANSGVGGKLRFSTSKFSKVDPASCSVLSVDMTLSFSQLHRCGCGRHHIRCVPHHATSKTIVLTNRPAIKYIRYNVCNLVCVDD